MAHTFLKRFILILIVLIALFAVLLMAKPEILVHAVKWGIESATSNQIITTKVGSLNISKDNVVLNNITVNKNSNEVIHIKKVDIQYDLKKSIKKLGLYFNLNISNFKMDDIALNAGGVFIIKSSMKKIDDFKIDFGNGAYMDCSLFYKTFLGAPYLLKADGDIEGVPLMLHKAFGHIAPSNGVVTFMRDFILNGKVSGKWHLNLDKEFFANYSLDPKNLDGKLKITGMDLKYDEEFPVVKGMNSDVIIKGTNIDFNIIEAYSGKVLLSDSLVTMDWGKPGDIDLIVKAKGKGDAAELTSFIPASNLQALKSHDIDLSAIKGQALIDVDIIIPLTPGTKNIYNITTDLTGVKLGIFGGNIELEDGKLKGKFDGDSVLINGPAKVNGFNSELNYQMNLAEEKKNEFDHSLQVKLNFAPTKAIKQGEFVASSGKAVVDISYILKNDDADFTINSDLKNVGFSVPKIGLYKPRGKNALLKLSGVKGGPMPSRLNISLLGADGLKIIGEYQKEDGYGKLSFSEIKYTNTDVKADVILGDHSIKLNVVGGYLDLSNADILRYLDKEAEATDTELLIKLDAVKMKNDIEISDVIMRIRCDKTKCYEGFLESRIGTKPLKMEMAARDNAEQWLITTGNAGAFLSSLGMYQKMHAGSLALVVNTSRGEVRAGEQISIIDGNFSISKFVIIDTPFVTRMLSFGSLQGLTELINNKKHVSFMAMKGQFGYKDGILSIDDAKGEGAFFDFTMRGTINTAHKEFKLKGAVIPSFYGANSIIRKIPIIGRITQVPYFIKDNY